MGYITNLHIHVYFLRRLDNSLCFTCAGHQPSEEKGHPIERNFNKYNRRRRRNYMQLNYPMWSRVPMIQSNLFCMTVLVVVFV